MVRIRLRRMGAKRQPSYRVVVANSEDPRDGRFIEIIGTYNPRTDPPTLDLQGDRAQYWLSVGAQPSEAVVRLLKKAGIEVPFAKAKKAAAAETPAETAQPAAPEA